MQTKDCAAKVFFRQEEMFAEAFNFLFFQGEMIVRPECLRERDTEQIFLRGKGKSKKLEGEMHRRDLLKMSVCQSDGKNTYLLMGMEVQSAGCRAMPVRMMCYDAREYERQVEEGSLSSRGTLMPVLSLVINLGEHPWRGPLGIAELFPPMPPRIGNVLADYPMRVLDPHRMSDGEIAKFSNELQYVFKAVKYGRNGRKLHSALRQGNGLVMPLTARCVSALLGISINEEKHQEGGKINMCRAIEQWRREDLAKGRAAGEMSALRKVVVACKKQKMTKENIVLLLSQVATDPNMDFEQFFRPGVFRKQRNARQA